MAHHASIDLRFGRIVLLSPVVNPERSISHESFAVEHPSQNLGAQVRILLVAFSWFVSRGDVHGNKH